MKLVLAEKPSVARDLARVLGAQGKQDGALAGNGWVVTWCIGHLVELDEPDAYDPSWKRWSWSTLPMVPERFRLRPARRTIKQWRVVRDLLAGRDFELVINACDAGREGELIFRYAYERAKSRLPIRRLWISSLTHDAIQKGFAQLRDGKDFEDLAAAARCRSEADWLVGLNATRAMTLVQRGAGLHSIGRVQTPTLALIVERELEIRRFVPRDFWEVVAKERFLATWTSLEGSTRLASEALAKELRARASQRLPLIVADVVKKELTDRPPQLFDLTSLQQAANRRFGFSAERTLKAAQALYEQHKLITYPRTSSRVLTEEERPELPKLVASFAGHPEYGPHASRLMGAPLTITKRIIDGAKVGDHHAIIPTGAQGSGARSGEALAPASARFAALGLPELRDDERKIFDLIVRRFLAVFHPDARHLAVEILLVAGESQRAHRHSGAKRRVGERSEGLRGRPKKEGRDLILDALPPEPDHFVARGRTVIDPGWHAVEPPKATDDQPLPELEIGERIAAELAITRGRTQPPHRLTDATLLGAMETAGKRVEDEALREAMKDRGLGTPATRASIIETLIQREYVRREKKSLVPTEKGIRLIERLPVPTLRSAEMTGEWEARLLAIARGAQPAHAFMADVVRFVRESVEKIRGVGAAPAAPVLQDELQELICPRCREKGLVRGRRAWGCAHWRTGCTFTVPYVFEGKKVTPKELQDLLKKGRTRMASFGRGRGRIHLEDGQPALKLA